MRFRGALVLSGVSLALAVQSQRAIAQSAPGFAIDRFDPSERGSQWFAADSLDLRGNGRPALGVVADWGYKPLVLYDTQGNEQVAIIRHQLFLHVGGALNLWNTLRIGVNLPLAVYQAGDAGQVGTTTYAAPESNALGDLRLSLTARLVGAYGDPASLALGVRLFVPSGKSTSYTGDDKVRAIPEALLAGVIGPFAYGARMGISLRPDASDGLGGATSGTELVFAAAAGYRSSDARFTFGPELYGSSVMSASGAFFSRKATPLEGLLGAHLEVGGGVRLGAGAGLGLTRGYGAPEARGVATLEWMPEVEAPPPPDRDGDGILDDQDACPDIAGVSSEDPAKNGCPLPADRDGDGIVDDQDACPDEKGVASEDPKKNGCPPPPPPKDTDKDGIIDGEDACPEEAGPASDDPKKNGCPLPKDRDGDGIMDVDDACPDQKGVASQDPKKNGCPQAVVSQGQIRILEQVKFKTGKADILPESESILTAVVNVLGEHKEIAKLRVEGHTDNKGARAMNRKLSTSRAASVVSWLVAHGIDRARLVSEGFGPDKPIAGNDTDEGRRENRRVEFHIVQEKE